jgi:hypothetical protein
VNSDGTYTIQVNDANVERLEQCAAQTGIADVSDLILRLCDLKKNGGMQ